jgi:hypothetical protein
MYHESLKLEPKEKSLVGTMNVFDADMKDHEKYHHLLLMWNKPIWEVVVVVKVQV